MPCGECTITLQDVVYLIGVPVNGKSLIERMHGSTAKICEMYLGKVPYGTNIKGSRVKLSWLDKEFGLNEYNTVEHIYQVSRAYILQMIGGILMSDKSENLVSVRFLKFLSTPWESSSQYSLGSTILACLYRELCKGAILEKGKKISGIGGCLLLLQAWAWQRLPFFTPVTRSYIQFPLCARWCKENHETGLAHNNVRIFRSLIDSYCQDQFIWQAYDDDQIFVPEYLMMNSNLWCTVAPLIHFSMVEFQFGDRVMRQFGFHQPIPLIPRDHYYLHALDERGRANTDWEAVHIEFISLWYNRAISVPERLPIETGDYDFESSEYIIWYRSNGKPYLTTLEGREECQRYKKKYSGKGKYSKTIVGSSSNTNLWSHNPEGWPTTWEHEVIPTVVWEKELASTYAPVEEQPEEQPECQPDGS